jgi:sporulation protein YlmC with PRC-barrel domain
VLPTLAARAPRRDAPGMRLTDLSGRPVLDDAGRPAGRVADLVVDHEESYPRVVAVAVRNGRSVRYVPWSAIGDQVVVRGDGSPTAPEGLRLVRDLLDAQVVDIAGRRLARVGEIELGVRDGGMRAVAVDVGLAPLARRLGLRRLARRLPSDMIDWQGIHFASGRGHQVQLASPAAAIHRLTPQERADVLERPRRRRYHVMRARKRAPS